MRKAVNTTQPITHIVKTFILSLCMLLTSQAMASLTAQVDRNQLSIEETFTLTVRASDSSSRGEPDFSQLSIQFDVLSRHQSSQVQYSNGGMTSFKEWTMTLAPKREGTLLIPSFNFEGDVSDAIEIKVTKAAAAPQGQQKDVFIETVIEKDSAYVQEQIKLSYRLYYSVNVDGLEAQPLELPNVTMETLQDKRYRREINGRFYNVAEFSYAIFPQESGQLSIPSLLWQVKVTSSQRPRSFFSSGRYEIKRLRTDGKNIEVKPIPAAFPADAIWLPASELTIAELWSKDPKAFNVGEPITRTIKISADQLMSSQLPEVLSNSQSSQLKVYTEQPSMEDQSTDKGIYGVRTESAAYVLSAPTEFTLPATTIPWWDTDENTLKYAKLPERELKAVGTAIAQAPNTPQTTNNPADTASTGISEEELAAFNKQIGFWKITTIVLSLLWILTLALAGWALLRRAPFEEKSQTQTDPTANIKNAFKKLEQACAKNSAIEIKQALVKWATLYFETSTPVTLSKIKTRFQNQDLNNLINALEDSLYKQGGPEFSQGLALAGTLKAIKKGQQHTDKQAKELEPLYAS